MRVRRPSRARRGFTLLAVLAVIVIILAGVLTAKVSTAVVADHDRVEIASRQLMQIMDSSRFSIVRFVSDVGDYPGKLSHLQTEILGNNAAYKNICRANYPNGAEDDWGGPYLIRSMTSSGLWVGIGMARDSLAKDPTAGTPSAGTPHALVILIDGVDQHDAYLLNNRNDPEGEATPSTLGRVRWGSPDSEGRVLLQFRKTITQC
jgi:type II secretory pathway pseudopilin PulG